MLKTCLSFFSCFLLFTFTGGAQSASSFFNSATKKAFQQDFEASLPDFDKAIQLDSNYTQAYYNRALSNMHLERYRVAIMDLDVAIRLQPDFVNAYTNRGISKIKSNDHWGALADFDSVIKYDSGNAPAYFMRGQIKVKTGKKTEGCLDLKKAQDLGHQSAREYLIKYCESGAE